MDLILKKSVKTLLLIEIFVKILFFMKFSQQKSKTMDFSLQIIITDIKFLIW